MDRSRVGQVNEGTIEHGRSSPQAVRTGNGGPRGSSAPLPCTSLPEEAGVEEKSTRERIRFVDTQAVSLLNMVRARRVTPRAHLNAPGGALPDNLPLGLEG